MLSWDKTPALATIRQCRAWVEIDLPALQHNVQQLTRHIGPQTALMAVVKADAYGHGAIAIAQAALAAGGAVARGGDGARRGRTAGSGTDGPDLNYGGGE